MDNDEVNASLYMGNKKLLFLYNGNNMKKFQEDDFFIYVGNAFSDEQNGVNLENFLTEEVSHLFMDFNYLLEHWDLLDVLPPGVVLFVHSFPIIQKVSELAFEKIFIFLTKEEFENYSHIKTLNKDLQTILNFHQLDIYNFNFNPNSFFILDKQMASRKLNLPFPDSSKNPNEFDYTKLIT